MARVLVTGGVRSGKSRYAEESIDAAKPACYITPGYPADPQADPEWAARVAAHQLRRPSGWRTVETVDIATAIREASEPILLDCLGTWVTRLFDSWQAWDQPREDWQARFDQALADLVAAIKSTPDIVLVTNEVGWGLVSEYPAGRVFADQLGVTNTQVAMVCDEVVLLVAGRPLKL